MAQGKKKYIETPEKLWDLFCAYREETKSNPIKQHDFVGKDAISVYREKERPLTYEGLKSYCHLHASTVNHYFENTDGAYQEYREVCTRIREEIRRDQIEGGMAGIYNPSITQRLNGLVDKSEEKKTVNIDLSVYTEEEQRLLLDLKRKAEG